MSYSAPVRASVDVTYACDLRCIHCRTNTGEIPLHIRRKMLTEAQLRTVIRDLDEMGAFEITLTGGEPTIRRSFWQLIEVVPTLQQSVVTLITNAARLLPEQIGRIVDSGIDSVRVSIDGTRETFERVRLLDVYEDVLRNSIRLAESVRSFKVLTTVMRTNLGNVFDLTNELRRCGIRRQDLILVRAHGRGLRNALLLTEAETMALHDAVQRFRLRVPCTVFDLNLNAPYLVPAAAPRHEDVVMFPYRVRDTSIAVSATGDVTMSRLYSSKPLGNVKDKSVQEIWREGQEQLVEELTDHSEEHLRAIFWDFDGSGTPKMTALLDRQIFEGEEVR